MTKLIKLTLFALSCLLVGCSQADAPRSNAAVTTEVALSDVPQNVSQVTAMDRALKCKPKQEKFICSQSAGNTKPDGLVFWRYA